MGAEAEVMVQLQHTIPVLDVPCCSDLDVKSPESTILQFIPSIRSGSFADTGPRRFMEDEHIRIDDLSAHLGSLMKFPKPSAFYGVTANYLQVSYSSLSIFKGRACLTFSFIGI